MADEENPSAPPEKKERAVIDLPDEAPLPVDSQGSPLLDLTGSSTQPTVVSTSFPPALPSVDRPIWIRSIQDVDYLELKVIDLENPDDVEYGRVRTIFSSSEYGVLPPERFNETSNLIYKTIQTILRDAISKYGYITTGNAQGCVEELGEHIVDDMYGDENTPPLPQPARTLGLSPTGMDGPPFTQVSPKKNSPIAVTQTQEKVSQRDLPAAAVIAIDKYATDGVQNSSDDDEAFESGNNESTNRGRAKQTKGRGDIERDKERSIDLSREESSKPSRKASRSRSRSRSPSEESNLKQPSNGKRRKSKRLQRKNKRQREAERRGGL